jgi:hypothetical protein
MGCLLRKMDRLCARGGWLSKKDVWYHGMLKGRGGLVASGSPPGSNNVISNYPANENTIKISTFRCVGVVCGHC